MKVGHVRWCEYCGKRGYESRRTARRAARLTHEPGLREYRCAELDGLWHVGHIPLATRAGVKTAREVYSERWAS